MAIDHSKTYKHLTVRNIPHILRKKQLEKQILNLPTNCQIYADFGCSNGYLTHEFSKFLSPNKTIGYDHNVENIEIARASYPLLNFETIDLNKPNILDKKSEVITCFETLEHVGDIPNAVQTIKNACQPGACILISVPIEIGFFGVIKYLLKRFIFKYDLPLNCGDRTYFFALLTGKDISQYRSPAKGYGTHFGFDYRVLDKIISSKFFNAHILKFNKFTSRFYLINLNNSDVVLKREQK